MKWLADRRAQVLCVGMFAELVSFAAAALVVVHGLGEKALGPLCLLVLALGGALLVLLAWYLRGQARLIETATQRIRAFLAGKEDVRIGCDEEGALYRLFHEINALAAILSAHAEEEKRAKLFLKNTLSDISHQLKTPLATLSIYNGIMQDETSDAETLREFSALSEQELDRIGDLVKNLLTISRLDAGTLVFDRKPHNLSALAASLERHFAFQARQEQKTLRFSGEEHITLICDRVWMLEALTNIIKNAFDHTSIGCTIDVRWRQFGQIVQITVRDNGAGIHPEDLPHIFKRFYRSRFSSNTQGVGLGLPLANAIIEAHSGTVEVDSEFGKGTVFTLNFLQPTKL